MIGLFDRLLAVIPEEPERFAVLCEEIPDWASLIENAAGPIYQALRGEQNFAEHSSSVRQHLRLHFFCGSSSDFHV